VSLENQKKEVAKSALERALEERNEKYALPPQPSAIFFAVDI